jgi:hypothetical protein
MDLHLVPTAFFAGCGPKKKNRNGKLALFVQKSNGLETRMMLM